MGIATTGIETLISIKQVATATVSNDEQQSDFSSYRGDSNYVSYLCPQQHILGRFIKQLQDNQTYKTGCGSSCYNVVLQHPLREVTSTHMCVFSLSLSEPHFPASVTKYCFITCTIMDRN